MIKEFDVLTQRLAVCLTPTVQEYHNVLSANAIVARPIVARVTSL